MLPICSHEPSRIAILLISSLGFLFIFKHLISLLNWIYTTFLRPPKNLITNYGSWALITGASDGVGKAFSIQLAQKGLNLILVSRSFDKLKAVSTEIQTLFPDTQVKVVVVDFTGDLPAGVRLIEEAIEGVDVGVLINNVGITYPGARYFHEVDEEVWMNVVRVNVEGTTRVTRAVLKGMIERKRGAIVSIGSAAAIVVPSHPLYAIYAATKSYIDQFSRSINVEYKSCGIDVQCQVPIYIATKMVSKMVSTEKPSLFIPTAEEYARVAIRWIGYEARCMPYWSHSLQWFFVSLLPEAIVDAWRLSIGIRRRGNFVLT